MSEVHGGGNVSSVDVLETSSVILDAASRRRYVLITASRDNTDPVFLKLSVQDPITNDVATVGEGIPLYPGDAYEMTANKDLFTGNVLAIKGAGSGPCNVLIQEGY